MAEDTARYCYKHEIYVMPVNFLHHIARLCKSEYQAFWSGGGGGGGKGKGEKSMTRVL